MSINNYLFDKSRFWQGFPSENRLKSHKDSRIHWEQIWHGNMSTKVAIEQFSAKWELELTNARLIVTPVERIKRVYMATDDLLSNVRSVTSSETVGFFRALQFPQSGGRSNAGSEQK
jgi:hypothetical protein